MLTEDWMHYREFAYPHDDLTPISESFIDSYNGWSATIVDALTTMASVCSKVD